MIDKVNLKAVSEGVHDFFEYQQVGTLNDHMLNIIKVENRTLDFHVHECSDEMFYVIEGQMEIELANRLVNMSAGDLIIIPAGTRHRPICTTPVTCLLIEKNGTLTKDNTGGTYQVG